MPPFGIHLLFFFILTFSLVVGVIFCYKNVSKEKMLEDKRIFIIFFLLILLDLLSFYFVLEEFIRFSFF